MNKIAFPTDGKLDAIARIAEQNQLATLDRLRHLLEKQDALSFFLSTEDEQRLKLQPIRDNYSETSRAYRVRADNCQWMLILVSIATYEDRLWLHVSYSLANSIPSYEQSCWVKKNIVGADRKAIMVFPQEAEHCNLHSNCLHLWSCLEADPLPDFRTMGFV